LFKKKQGEMIINEKNNFFSFLSDIKINFQKYFLNKKNEEEDNKNKIKNLITILKTKINEKTENIEMPNIGCGGKHSWIFTGQLK
jgi:hypothetical protein